MRCACVAVPYHKGHGPGAVVSCCRLTGSEHQNVCATGCGGLQQVPVFSHLAQYELTTSLSANVGFSKVGQGREGMG